LSVVKLEEMAARAAAEAEAKVRAEKEGRDAAVDKTLPAPPVPSGKPSGYGANRRVSAQHIFHQKGPEEETMERADTEAGAEVVPRTPSLSALSLLRPPPRHGRLSIPSYEGQNKDEGGLDALERRLAEQVGTRKHPALPPPDLRTVLGLGSTLSVPPPPPVPAPVPVPGKSMAQEQTDDVDSGAAVNESAISSLALGAEEDFGGRNAKTIPNLVLPDVLVDGEEEAEGEDADADGRTQRLGKGTGASSSSERGTYKALSRKSAKSDSKEKDRDKERERRKSEGKAKKKKKRRDERDDEAVRLRSAAKGRIAEWLGKLEVGDPGPEPEPELDNGPEPEPEPDSAGSPPEPEQEPASQTEPAPVAIAAAPAAPSPTVPPPVIESKPNPRSSGFVAVSTLRRAPISLPPESAPAEPSSSSNGYTIPAPVPVHVRRLAQKYAPPSQVEVKYDVKSARGGRGGRVTSVAAIWAKAAKSVDSSAGASAGASAGSGSGAATPTLTPSPTPMSRQAKPSRPAAGKGSPKAAQTKAAATAVASNKVSMKPMTSIVGRVPLSPIPVLARTPRPIVRQPPSSAPAREKEKEVSRPPRTLFGLGAAAAATPSSPALSSSIATPVLSSTASLARPPATTTTTNTQPAMGNNTPSPSSSPFLLAQTQTQPHHPPHPSQPAPAPAAGQRPPIVNGGGLKAAELAFGQARLRDLIKRYQGQMA